MEQCVEIGRPALAVKVYSEMQKAGIHPSAVTYGFYNKAIMEGRWPSTKRRWNVLRIVIFACLHLRELGQKVVTEGQHKNISSEETKANFRLLHRSSSFNSSEMTVNALDVGLDESHLMERRDSMGRLTRGSVYRLTSRTSTQTQSDYAVRGDSFYIADKSPLLQCQAEPIRERWMLGGRTGSTIHSSEQSYRKGQPHTGDGARVEVCLSSCSQCTSCQCLLYDEEIMVCWSEGSAEEYNISCPYCNNSLVPSLTVVIRKVRALVGISNYNLIDIASWYWNNQ